MSTQHAPRSTEDGGTTNQAPAGAGAATTTTTTTSGNNSTDTGGGSGSSPARPNPEAEGTAAAAAAAGGEVDSGAAGAAAAAAAVRALPAPEEGGGDSAVQTLQVDGKPIALDQLGPMVVHKDGTLSRIANWPEMTEVERRNTVRVLVKRNQIRLGALREGQGLSKEGQGEGEGEAKAKASS